MAREPLHFFLKKKIAFKNTAMKVVKIAKPVEEIAFVYNMFFILVFSLVF